jgi:hypothetical protein
MIAGSASAMQRCSILLASGFLAGCTSGTATAEPDAGSSVVSGGPGETPTVLASGQKAPGAIAVGNGFVYWVVADGTVMRVPAAGGTPASVGGGCRTTALAIDAMNAYCAGNDQSVRSIALAGGAVSVLAASEPALDLAVAGSRVYFTTYYGEHISGGNAISVVGAVPTDGGAVEPLATAQLLPSSIVVDGVYAYWIVATQDDNGSRPASGVGIVRAQLDGGAPLSLGSFSGISPGLSGLNKAIAVDSSSVYVSNEQGVVRVPLVGGPPTTLATGFSGPLAVDGVSVYWAVFGSTSGIMKTPISGGTSRWLVSGVTIASLAVDATAVYWTDPSHGTVAKAPK